MFEIMYLFVLAIGLLQMDKFRFELLRLCPDILSKQRNSFSVLSCT